jgi:hypothetical protein
MRQRLVLLLVLAAALATADLTVKRLLPTDPWLFHQRSHAWIELSVALLLALALLPRLPSRFVALAGGILAGGVLGNLVSARWNDGLVPNPFVMTGDDGVVAFNLADVFVLSGILLLTAAVVRVTIRHRDVLPQSTVAVRAFRRVRAARR